MVKKQISYSEAITEIETILQEIEDQDPDVDELSDKVKRVAELLNICKDKLRNTEEEVEKILRDMDDSTK
ncbi:MAG: exodeoxyribonuclease VII small subunit [Bacteroidales bacterium]|nr:exodeoxyribonuclease VII small subunit [Bacteroidales bacterium]